MSVLNPERIVTKQDLKDFYDGILPYLGGNVEAGFTPIGTIIAVMGNAAPTNYLACNGQVVNIADYPELANYFLAQFGSRNYFGGNGTTTFGIPDLRGEFLRGTGTNGHSGEGNGANVGTHQGSSFFRTTAFSTTNRMMIVKGYAGDWDYNPQAPDKYTTPSQVNQLNCTFSSMQVQTDTTGQQPSKATIRPTNTSVLYCIATKNIYMNPSLDYTEEEKVVGQWITGKPLYQRTIHFPKAALSSGRNQLSHNIANVDIAWLDNTSFFHESSFNETFIVGSENSDTAFQVTWLLASQTIVDVTITESMYNRLTSSSNDGIFATIQYIKTTD